MVLGMWADPDNTKNRRKLQVLKSNDFGRMAQPITVEFDWATTSMKEIIIEDEDVPKPRSPKDYFQLDKVK